jgi:hypothetical protein
MSRASRLLPASWKRRLRERFGERVYARRSYSQEGEDLVLERLFEQQQRGVYVDVGAHHPFRFSNTCLLHRRGWRGINIDALPGSMAAFARFRPGDINLEVGVDTEAGTLQFHLFEEPALNTFDAALADERQRAGWPLRGTKPVQRLQLATILERELPRLGASGIDLLTVDVEGLDLSVLRSNDWARFRPQAVVVEILDQDLPGVMQSAIGRFCDGVGYRPFAKMHHTVVFVRR